MVGLLGKWKRKEEGEVLRTYMVITREREECLCAERLW